MRPDIDAIRARVDTVNHRRLNAHQCEVLARQACREAIPALLAYIERLEAALRPFAECAVPGDSRTSECERMIYPTEGELARARFALNGED